MKYLKVIIALTVININIIGLTSCNQLTNNAELQFKKWYQSYVNEQGLLKPEIIKKYQKKINNDDDALLAVILKNNILIATINNLGTNLSWSRISNPSEPLQDMLNNNQTFYFREVQSMSQNQYGNFIGDILVKNGNTSQVLNKPRGYLKTNNASISIINSCPFIFNNDKLTATSINNSQAKIFQLSYVYQFNKNSHPLKRGCWYEATNNDHKIPSYNEHELLTYNENGDIIRKEEIMTSYLKKLTSSSIWFSLVLNIYGCNKIKENQIYNFKEQEQYQANMQRALNKYTTAQEIIGSIELNLGSLSKTATDLKPLINKQFNNIIKQQVGSLKIKSLKLSNYHKALVQDNG